MTDLNHEKKAHVAKRRLLSSLSSTGTKQSRWEGANITERDVAPPRVGYLRILLVIVRFNDCSKVQSFSILS